MTDPTIPRDGSRRRLPLFERRFGAYLLLLFATMLAAMLLFALRPD